MENEKSINVFSKDGLNIYKIHFDKFKTNTISVYFHDDLKKETAALNALLPAVLKQGCKEYPTRKDISIRLQELYGAVLESGVSKKGELQLIYFYVETIRDAYTGNNQKLSRDTFDLLFKIISNPAIENGSFNKETVEVEKANLKNQIQSIINDKMAYSVERCFEEMCKDEAFGIHEYGDISDYDKIDETILFEHYQKVLTNLPISVYITGEADDELIEDIKKCFMSLKREQIKTIRGTTFGTSPSKAKYVEEKLNINQGKLCIGFRTNINPSNDEYYKLMVYNSVLGGGIHSKLFQNVREKAGLAYYAYSRLERFKGIMLISSGIEISNKEKVIQIIDEQLQNIIDGNISEYEFESSIKSIVNSINSMKDSQISLSDFVLSQNLLGTKETLDSIIEKIHKVTKEDIISISNKIVKDTVYFLTEVLREE